MTAPELLTKHLSFAGPGASPEEALEVYHDDVTIDFPFAPEGHTRRLEGRDAVVRYFGNIKNFTEGFKLGEPELHTIEGGLVAIYPGTATFTETGLPYAQEYVLFLTVRDGRIAAMREYYDGQRVLRALGELD